VTGLYKIGVVQGPQKLNDGSRKMIHLGMRDLGFTVVEVTLGCGVCHTNAKTCVQYNHTFHKKQ
jgi:hypothetical protein